MASMMLSILIATLESRRDQFAHLFERLTAQVRDAEPAGEIEILSLRDNREASIGTKRNRLIRQASGRFVAFVDDDDDVSDDYISRISAVIRGHPEIDCVGIKVIVTFRGSHPREMTYSLSYDDYFSRGHSYFRPPHHWNPILRSVALEYPFLDASYAEDAEWALRLRRSGALRREEFIGTPVYFYKSRRWWPYQLLLDWTEPVRHALGLRSVNRLRLNRASMRLE
jgi:glycosyltransferase involved in cell wall biosynthesis